MPSTNAQPPLNVRAMKELFRSNDPVRMSAATSLLESEGIVTFQMDQHMSVLEGSIGVLAARLMVADRHEFMARSILRDNGLDD